jgi:hypothetical protein
VFCSKIDALRYLFLFGISLLSIFHSKIHETTLVHFQRNQDIPHLEEKELAKADALAESGQYRICGMMT